MRLLAASANIEEILEAKDFGAYGIVTNPTIIAEEKKPWRQSVEESASVLDGPYHLQITEEEPDKIRRQVEEFYEVLGDRLIIKACINKTNLSFIDEWHTKGFKVNITGIVSIPQAFVAIQAKADFVSIYLGRADKIGVNGIEIVQKASQLINLKNYQSEVVSASIKDPKHFVDAALAGSDWVACPVPLMRILIENPVTTQSIIGFKKDWLSISGSIKPISKKIMQ